MKPLRGRGRLLVLREVGGRGLSEAAFTVLTDGCVTKHAPDFGMYDVGELRSDVGNPRVVGSLCCGFHAAGRMCSRSISLYRAVLAD